MTTSFEPPINPCIGKCSSHLHEDGICRGCFRTRKEVRDWNAMSPETKLSTVQMTKIRRRKLSDAS